MRKYFRAIFISLVSISAIGQEENPQIVKGIIEYRDLFNTSMNKNAACYRIPAIVTAANGDLVVAIDERVQNCGDLNVNNDINIVIRRSTDNGKTWSEIENFSKFPECDFPTGTNKQGPLAGFSFWESISIILDYRYLFLDISAPIRIS